MKLGGVGASRANKGSTGHLSQITKVSNVITNRVGEKSNLAVCTFCKPSVNHQVECVTAPGVGIKRMLLHVKIANSEWSKKVLMALSDL